MTDRCDEADLAILDELAVGSRSLDELRVGCDVDVTGILDRWEEIAAGPGGVARVERLLAALSLDRDGPERFAARVAQLVDRGLVAVGDAGAFRLTAEGASMRRSCS